MDHSLPRSAVHGILQARILEWVACALLQEIFLTQGSNPHLPHLLHWQAGSLPLVPPGKPINRNSLRKVRHMVTLMIVYVIVADQLVLVLKQQCYINLSNFSSQLWSSVLKDFWNFETKQLLLQLFENVF